MEPENLASADEKKSRENQPVYNSTLSFFVYCGLQEM